ncbi:MAG: ABC transporter ATP-binding protein [Clostridia bacterium]|jgi:ATP-binding cassette subfamily B protein
MVKIMSYLKNDWWKILIIFGLTFGQSMASLALPSYMSDIVNTGIPNGDTAYILNIGGLMLLVSVAGIIAQSIARFLSSRVSAAFSSNVRGSVFRKVESYSLSEFDRFSSSSLITRCTNDVTQIQNFLDMILRMAISAPMTAIGGVILAIRYGKNLSWILVASCTLIVAVMSLNFTLTVPKFKKVQTMVDKLNLITRENLSGMRVIRAFNTQDIQDDKFEKANAGLTGLHLKIGRIMAAMQPMTMVVMNISTVIALWLGSKMVGAASIKVGDLMAFVQYIMQIMFSFQMLSMTFVIIPRASVSIKRIYEVLDTDPAIKDPLPENTIHNEPRGVVEFINVTFNYPGSLEPAIKNITFKSSPGQTTAIIGSTGSGKSTLVNMIPRLYDTTSGEVLVDDVNVRCMTQHELRDSIGYVPQKNMLFAGDIESNIRFGRNVSEEELQKTAYIAQASSFINEKENGFASEISQAGTNVSGGQKQRISIARALVNSPKIYIFDDSFSSLDFKTESMLRSQLIERTRSSTVFIVTQRVSTIMNCDQIIVLDKGEMVGIGKHKDLLKSCQVYYEIASSQLSKEELS